MDIGLFLRSREKQELALGKSTRQLYGYMGPRVVAVAWLSELCYWLEGSREASWSLMEERGPC